MGLGNKPNMGLGAKPKLGLSTKPQESMPQNQSPPADKDMFQPKPAEVLTKKKEFDDDLAPKDNGEMDLDFLGEGWGNEKKEEPPKPAMAKPNMGLGAKPNIGLTTKPADAMFDDDLFAPTQKKEQPFDNKQKKEEDIDDLFGSGPAKGKKPEEKDVIFLFGEN